MKRYTWQAAAFLGVLLTTAMAVGQSSRVLDAYTAFPVVVARTLTTGRYAVLSSSHHTTFC